MNFIYTYIITKYYYKPINTFIPITENDINNLIFSTPHTSFDFILRIDIQTCLYNDLPA